MKLAIYALPALLLAATPCLAQAVSSDDATSPRGGVMDTNPNPTPQNSGTNLEGSTSGIANSSGALNNGTAPSASDTTASAAPSSDTSMTASSSAPSNQVAMNDTPSPKAHKHMSERQENAQEAQETQQLNENEAQYASNAQ